MSVHSSNVEGSNRGRSHDWISEEPPSPVRRRPRDEMRSRTSSRAGQDDEEKREALDPSPRRSIESRRGRIRRASIHDSVSRNSAAEPTRLALDPRTNRNRILGPGPRLIDFTEKEKEHRKVVANCVRSHFRGTPLTGHNYNQCTNECTHPRPPWFIVVGLFEGPDMAPKERIVYIKHKRWVFWNLWWGILRLRGIRSIFSLIDCTAFKIYDVPPAPFSTSK